MNPKKGPVSPQDRPSRHITANSDVSDATASRAVSWWSVHQFIDAVLNQVNGWPQLGTPAWCSLAHEDPRKWAALLDGAQHHALRLELNQEARADAGVAVSESVDWGKISREVKQRSDFYADRPWLRRSAARS